MEKSSFELSDNPIVNCVQLGNQSPPAVVIDNFYKYPERIYSIANSLDYDLMFGARRYRNYPGRRSYISWKLETVHRTLIETFNQYYREGIKQDLVRYKPVVFTKMDMGDLHSADTLQKVPHIDDESVATAIIYLSDEDATIESGTYFYEHKASGLRYLPDNPTMEIVEMMAQIDLDPLAAHSYRTFIKKLMSQDSDKLPLNAEASAVTTVNPIWEITSRVEAKFNRCLLFPARHFHSAVLRPKSDTTARYVRTTQNIFLSYQ